MTALPPDRLRAMADVLAVHVREINRIIASGMHERDALLAVAQACWEASPGGGAPLEAVGENRPRRGYPPDDMPLDQMGTLRAELSSVTMYLDDLLDAGRFPGKGRSIDDKSAITEWWEERRGAVESARAAIGGISVEEYRANTEREEEALRQALPQGTET